MIGRHKLGADQAWTLERRIRQQMKKTKNVTVRQAARVAERVRGEQLGVPKDDVAVMEAAERKRARRAGRVLPQGHSGVPTQRVTKEIGESRINGEEIHAITDVTYERIDQTSEQRAAGDGHLLPVGDSVDTGADLEPEQKEANE